MTDLSHHRLKYILAAVLLLACAGLFFCPLIISIDSILGFHAYKGTLINEAFNYRTEVSAADITKDNFIYVSWWSPGQWLFPAIFHYLLGLDLGHAMTLVTIIAAISGMAGFYRVFRYFNFSRVISYYSLLVIFCSYTFFYSFIVYQGGEILSFGIFPWFLYYVLTANRISFKNLSIITLLFLLCFIAKTTMMIYCLAVIAYKIAEPSLIHFIENKKVQGFRASGLLYAIPAILSVAAVQLFLSKGPVPSAFAFNATLSDVLVPLASPINGLLSINQLVGRADEAGLLISQQYFNIILIAVFAWLWFRLLKHKDIPASYKAILIILYISICCFFYYLYFMDTGVDYSPRHYKLMSYLFLPGFITLLMQFLKPKIFRFVFMGIGIASLAFFVYTKYDWVKGRYLSEESYYRNYDNKYDIDPVDKESYDRLMALAYSARQDSTIFFIEANHDIVLDIRSRCIVPWRNITMPYYGHGPGIIACVSRKTLLTYPDLLPEKFPGYTIFEKIDETAACVFFRCR
jgi:hypothetical protein